MSSKKHKMLTKREHAIEEYIGALIEPEHNLEQQNDQEQLKKSAEINDIIEKETDNESKPGAAPEVTDKAELPVELKTIDQQPGDTETLLVCVFKVSGITMALPAEKLSSIIVFPDGINFDNHTNLMTIKECAENNNNSLQVIDLCNLISGNRSTEKNKKIINIGNDYGIAVDSVEQEMGIDVEDVRWSTGKTKRKWLAGTVIKHKLALIDIEKLVEEVKST